MRLLATAFGSDMDTKVLACLTAYRRESQRLNCTGVYNEFIRKLKASIGGKGRLWLSIVEENIGLLEGDSVTMADVEAFLLPPSQEGSDVKGPIEDDEDDDDLLDQL